MARMSKKQVEEMNEYFQEMDTVQGMNATYSGDVDMPDGVLLTEDELSPDIETYEDDYSEEELEVILQNVNFEDSRTNLSFDEINPVIPEESGVKYQRKERVIQPHYLIIRENVKKTPSVCSYRDCMYDGAQALGFKNWDKTPDSKRRVAIAALDKHTQLKHKFQDSDIIDESQIPKSWLSPTIL